MKEIFEFLRQVAMNNNKVWFDAHREQYREARTRFEQRAQQLIDALSEIDEQVADAPCHGSEGGKLTVKDVTYRFNRDTRFSPDKSPYKRHFGAYVAPWGKKSLMGGYYMHYEPDECMLGVGCYYLEPKVLRIVREIIVERIDEYRQIVDNPTFRSTFPNLGIERVKTCPKGFNVPQDIVEYIRPKDYCAWVNVPDSFFVGDDWLERTMQVFTVAKPFLDFINEAIDTALTAEPERTDIF